MVFLRIEGRVQFQIESRDHGANRHAHLQPCKILSGTTGWAHRERNEGVGVVYILFLRIVDLGFQRLVAVLEAANAQAKLNQGAERNNEDRAVRSMCERKHSCLQE